jgi:hypothetical protein
MKTKRIRSGSRRALPQEDQDQLEGQEEEDTEPTSKPSPYRLRNRGRSNPAAAPTFAMGCAGQNFPKLGGGPRIVYSMNRIGRKT